MTLPQEKEILIPILSRHLPRFSVLAKHFPSFINPSLLPTFPLIINGRLCGLNGVQGGHLRYLLRRYLYKTCGFAVITFSHPNKSIGRVGGFLIRRQAM